MFFSKKKQGFTLRCNKCGAKADVTMEKDGWYAELNKNSKIKVRFWHDGNWTQVNCECGNVIKGEDD